MRMAASPAQRPNGPGKSLTLALLLITTFLNDGVTAQEMEVVTGTAAPVVAEEFVRGDMIDEDPQVPVFPTVGPTDITEQPTVPPTPEAEGEAGEAEGSDSAAPGEAADGAATFTVQIFTERPEAETPAPQPDRGDGPNIVPKPFSQDDVICVTKESIQDKNAVSLKLKIPSNCEESRTKIASVLMQLCGEDCKLDIYQEDNSEVILVSGGQVQENVASMTDMFNNDNIKDKIGVEEAVTHWGKSSKLVLVSLLLIGLLLAALLVAGYYLKTHHKSSKGVRLAESFQVDEENQANTLVSVAPLPQEPADKPNVNGESPPENGTNQAPTTNGHSATQTPVADTEM
ncbi:uncharacterized protein LOC142996436 [Genypterus blacodes]|uniref:uncharacterized protein LOC142996436 n=1 Tax=Genypterus blacodes TaxID=154954 RepID=UPI003F76684B